MATDRFFKIHHVQFDLHAAIEQPGEYVHSQPSWLRCALSSNNQILGYELWAGYPSAKSSSSAILIQRVGYSALYGLRPVVIFHHNSYRIVGQGLPVVADFSDSATKAFYLMFQDRFLAIFYDWPVGIHGVRATLFRASTGQLIDILKFTAHAYNCSVNGSSFSSCPGKFCEVTLAVPTG